MKAENPPTVSLRATSAGQNTVRIDVNLKNAPENLFGASFHLVISGSAWRMADYGAGNVFYAPGFSPMVLAQEKTSAGGQKEIVFGLSLRRMDSVAVRDGTVASFYLLTDAFGELRLDFTDAHLSVLASQHMDLKDAVWQGNEFDLKSMVADVAPATATMQADLRASVLRTDDPSVYAAEVSQFYTAMLFVVLAFTLLIAVYLIWRRIRRPS